MHTYILIIREEKRKGYAREEEKIHGKFEREKGEIHYHSSVDQGGKKKNPKGGGGNGNAYQGNRQEKKGRGDDGQYEFWGWEKRSRGKEKERGFSAPQGGKRRGKSGKL